MIRRVLLLASLLVTLAAPAWAQSDKRWVAIFAPQGTLGKGGDTYGDAGTKMGINPFVVETILRRMGVPYKVILLPDSAGGWARQLGDTRDTDEADSTHFRKNGCMGWISYMGLYSGGTALKGFTGELRAVFTDAEGNRGVQRGSPLDGNWGIPGVVFMATDMPSGAGANLLSGVNAHYSVTGHSRNRSLFANGDSLSTESDYAALPDAAQSANYTAVLSTPDFDASGDSLPVIAWRYKTNTMYYYGGNGLLDPKLILLGIADIFTRAGYTPRRKLNLHIDMDHPYPDATVQTAPTDSLFRYLDAMGDRWRFGGPVEAHASETIRGGNPDDSTLAVRWKSRSSRWPGTPHSHNYLNFNNTGSPNWDLTAFSDSATKRSRYNDLWRAIRDSIRHVPARGYENTGTFPNNDVNFPDLYIFASDGVRDIRTQGITGASVDSIGAPRASNMRRWQRVPSPRRSTSSSTPNYGLPYSYIEPKTGRLLYVHDALETPTSNDSVTTDATDYSVSMEGFASRNLSHLTRMAVWDGGAYWHPDLNVTRGRFMADFHRRLLYFYNRTSNIMTVQPIYRPKTPRTAGTRAGGTAR